MFNRMLRIWWPKAIRKGDIWEKLVKNRWNRSLGETDLVGYTVKKTGLHIRKQVSTWSFQGKRKQGRPRWQMVSAKAVGLKSCPLATFSKQSMLHHGVEKIQTSHTSLCARLWNWYIDESRLSTEKFLLGLIFEALELETNSTLTGGWERNQHDHKWGPLEAFLDQYREHDEGIWGGCYE